MRTEYIFPQNVLWLRFSIYASEPLKMQSQIQSQISSQARVIEPKFRLPSSCRGIWGSSHIGMMWLQGFFRVWQEILIVWYLTDSCVADWAPTWSCYKFSHFYYSKKGVYKRKHCVSSGNFLEPARSPSSIQRLRTRPGSPPFTLYPFSWYPHANY